MKELHCSSIFSRVRLYVRDQDQQLMSSFIATIPTNCGFHKLNRNLTHHTEYEHFFRKLKETNLNGYIEAKMIVKWLWAFLEDYETVEEANLSLELLKEYLTEEERKHCGQIGEAFREKLRCFITAKFVDMRHHLFHCHFHRVPPGNNTTSNVVEAENLTLQKIYCGPRPKDQLDGATKKIIKTNDIQAKRKATSVTYHLTARASKPIHREEGFLDRVTVFADQKCIEQMNSAETQCVFIVGPNSSG
jgi:hypothetical protein